MKYGWILFLSFSLVLKYAKVPSLLLKLQAILASYFPVPESGPAFNPQLVASVWGRQNDYLLRASLSGALLLVGLSVVKNIPLAVYKSHAAMGISCVIPGSKVALIADISNTHQRTAVPVSTVRPFACGIT